MNKRIGVLVRIVCALVLVLASLPKVVLGQERQVTVDELAKRADVVVVGKVTAMKSEWNNDKSRIYTRVTVGVDQYLKGEGTDQSLTIVTPGGEIDGVGELYSHTARFMNDEEVVVFAEKDKRGELRVAGGPQGKYSIRQNEMTGQPMIAEDTPLEQFVARVKSISKGQSEK